MQNKIRISLPTVFLLVFLLVTNIAGGLYISLAIQPVPAFQILNSMGFLWVLGWWVVDDNRTYGLKWVSSLEIILYFLSLIVVPIYLFKTRGWKAFLILLSFIVLYIWFYFLGVIIGVVVKGF